MLEKNNNETVGLSSQKKREEILKYLNIGPNKKVITFNCNITSFIQTEIPVERENITLKFPLVKKKWSLCSKYEKASKSKDLRKERNENNAKNIKKKTFKMFNIYGTIEGVKIGTHWNSRLDCLCAKVHRQTVAGIHPGKDGAYSIALSGNYEDDQDNGSSFIYTGSGGRNLRGTEYNRKNLRTAPQSKNQTVNGANKSLIRSIETKNPVRVIRGFKLKSQFAPSKGYRYDGLYTVEKYWISRGISGFIVYKFLMKRCENQSPAPWEPGFEGFATQLQIMKTRKSIDYRNNENDGNFIENVDELLTTSIKNNNLIKPDVRTNSDSSPEKLVSNFKTKVSSYYNLLSEEASCSKSKGDDNKENNTINITDDWCNTENYISSDNISISTNTSISNLSNDVYISNSFQSKKNLPERYSGSSKFTQNENNIKLWVKQTFTKLYENPTKIISNGNENIRESENGISNNKIDETSDVFRGFDTQHCPNKIVLLGFLIHEMENKLFQ